MFLKGYWFENLMSQDILNNWRVQIEHGSLLFTRNKFFNVLRSQTYLNQKLPLIKISSH